MESKRSTKVTRKMEQALVALMGQPTLSAAATCAGVKETRLLQWLQRDDFQDRYRELRWQAVRHAVAHLHHLGHEAVETLQHIMSDSTVAATARISAAKTILEVSVKSIEVEDLEHRLRTLENEQGLEDE